MIHFELVSAAGVKFKNEAYEVLIPTKDGTIAVFEDHMPLLSAGAPGVISVRRQAQDSDDDMDRFAVNGGVLEVDGKNARFLAEEVTASDEFSEREAEAALEHAKQLVENAKDQVALQEAKRVLHHTSAQLQVAKVKKRHHR